MRKRAILFTSLVAGVSLTAGVLTAGAAGAAPAVKPLPNSAPKWLAHAQHVGKANASSAVDVRVYLQPNGGSDALAAFVDAVSTPGSPAYQKFLTPAQYHQRFDPTSAQVATVKSWLTRAGLRVAAVNSDDSYVEVTGTVAQAQTTFGTSLESYAHDGQLVRANSSAVQLPDTVAGLVSAVTGLDTTIVKMRPDIVDAPPSVFRNARPCSTWYGQLTAKLQADYRTPLPQFKGEYLPYAICGYTGPQFRAAYENNTALDGAGATVAIVDAYASPYNFADARTYARLNGDAPYRNGQYTEIRPPQFTHQADCDPTSWTGEEALDTEAVHAMAGAANIRYYAAASCYDQDLLDTLNKVINQHQAQVISNSWGEADQFETTDALAAYTNTFRHAAATGISVLFSSGDNGDELAKTGLRQPDSPASNPYVTAVGGTATGIDYASRLTFQTGWGTDKWALSANGKYWTPVGFLYGAGGGFSNLFNRPGYQNGVVPATAPPGRAVPDVAMDADPTTGMLVGFTQTFPNGSVQYSQYRIGGTSLASPLFAGMTALRIQNTGGSAGFLNPTIYSHRWKFTDVTGAAPDPGNVRVDYVNGVDPSNGYTYSVRTFNQDSSLTTHPGWDDVTGVGVPNTAWIRP